MPTTIKAALKKWEEATARKAGEAREIKLIGVYPPIEKMEGPFHLLINCEKFSLSTNQISNISNLQAFKTLKVLSLGRNLIKSLQGKKKALGVCITTNRPKYSIQHYAKINLKLKKGIINIPMS